MSSRLIVNQIRHTGASADAITMDASGNVTFPANATCSGTATGFGGGKVLQVVQVVKKNTQSHTGTTFVDVAGFNPSLTPTATGSKILLDISINGNASGQGAFDLYRSIGGGSYTQLTDFIGDSGSNVYRTTFSFGGQAVETRENVGLKILDSPSYSSGQAIAYKLKMGSPHYSTYEIHINRVKYIYNGNNYDKNCISTFTLTEIGA